MHYFSYKAPKKGFVFHLLLYEEYLATVNGMIDTKL